MGQGRMTASGMGSSTWQTAISSGNYVTECNNTSVNMYILQNINVACHDMDEQCCLPCMPYRAVSRGDNMHDNMEGCANEE